MKPGLSFFDFFRARAFSFEDPASTEWADRFLDHVLNDSMKAVGHDGDCTKQAFTCDLCLLEEMLSEYREYRFNYDKWLLEQEE